MFLREPQSPKNNRKNNRSPPTPDSTGFSRRSTGSQYAGGDGSQTDLTVPAMLSRGRGHEGLGRVCDAPRLFYGCSYGFHLSGDDSRDCHVEGSAAPLHRSQAIVVLCLALFLFFFCFCHMSHTPTMVPTPRPAATISSPIPLCPVSPGPQRAGRKFNEFGTVCENVDPTAGREVGT